MEDLDLSKVSIIFQPLATAQAGPNDRGKCISSCVPFPTAIEAKLVKVIAGVLVVDSDRLVLVETQYRELGIRVGLRIQCVETFEGLPLPVAAVPPKSTDDVALADVNDGDLPLCK